MTKNIKISAYAICAACLCFVLHFALSFITNIYYQIGVGFCSGIFLASLGESYIHQYIGHAKAKVHAVWRRHPRTFMVLIIGFFLHHVVHHGKTYREGYLEQFGESLDPNAVDTWAPEAFYRLFDAKDQAYVRKAMPAERIIEELHKADYGLGAVSTVAFACLMLPLVAVVFVVAPLWMALSAALPMLIIFPMMSDFIHRHMMHLPQDGVVVVRHDSSPSWLVGTAYMKALERWHWMHHEYIYCNYNLFVLADFFRGVNRTPSPKDRQKMAAEGLILDDGGWSWMPFRRPSRLSK
jgi:hypothetical protein